MSLFADGGLDNEPGSNQGPLVSFGLFSDVHHSGKKDYVKTEGPAAYNYFCESSLGQLTDAVHDWNQSFIPVSFVLSLGDLTDSSDDPYTDRDSALLQVLDVLAKYPRAKYHVIGHQELKQFSRKELQHSKIHSAVNAPGAIPANHDRFYYHFSPTPGVRIIVIDTYEVSVLGFQDDQDCDEYIRAKQILKDKNPNGNTLESDNMPWYDSKYTSVNGTTTSIQLQWLVEVLDYCQKAGETAIVCGHNPLCVPEKRHYSRVPWNNNDILNILHRFSCVVAYLSGHNPDGGYLQDSNSIHHISVPSICSSPPNSNAFATVHVFNDRMEVKGCGRMPSMTLYHHGQAEIITTAAQEQPPPQPPVLLEAQYSQPQLVQPVMAPHMMPTPDAEQKVLLNPQQEVVGSMPMSQQLIQVPTSMAVQQPSVLVTKPATRRVLSTKPIPVMTSKAGKHRAHGDARPPPIVAARLRQEAQDMDLGPIRKAVPVTVAIPIEKINAMGGIKNFQLAEIPKDALKDINSAGMNVNGQRVFF